MNRAQIRRLQDWELDQIAELSPEQRKACEADALAGELANTPADEREAMLDVVEVGVLATGAGSPEVARGLRAQVDERGFWWLAAELGLRERAIDDEQAARKLADGFS